MRYRFVKDTLEELLEDRTLSVNDEILVVAGATVEKELFEELEFASVTISNLDERMDENAFSPFKWSYQDAQHLSYSDKTFDFAFVSDGLHHCSSPHTALLEMYRVSRKGIIVFESRDSVLMRLAHRLGLTPNYELEAVVGNDFMFGGVNNSNIPNYIYRWTEREFQKTIRSFDPVGKHTFKFFYGLNLPYPQAQYRKTNWKTISLRILDPFVRFFTKLFKGQCNSFCMVALKPDLDRDLWPWLKLKDGQPTIDRQYALSIFKEPED